MTKKFNETKIPANGSNRVTLVKEFLDANYDIRINIFDQSKVSIHCKTNRYSADFPIELENISLHMEEEGIRGCDAIMKKLLTSLHDMTPFNPIVDYLESMRGKFSGESHIDKICSFIVAHNYGDKDEDDYYQKRLVYTFRKWIVATVAQVFALHANDVNFMLVDAQTGMGKSWFFDFLVPDQLFDYYTTSVKDMSFATFFTQNFLIRFDEMVGVTRSNSEEYKNILSQNYINVSKRFTHRKQRFASCCGTSNKDDEHGGFLLPEWSLRRFAINRVDFINWEEYIKVVDKNQIWAEGMMLLDQNFEYVWDRDDFSELEEYNARFLVQTTSFKLIKEFYRVPENGETELGIFKMPVEILRDLRNARKINSSMNTVSDVNIGIALKQLGYTRYGKKLNGQTRYGYDVVQLF